MKLYKSPTWEFFFAFLFQYGKVTFITLFFFQRRHRIAVYYTLLCFILWLVLAHPKFSGPSKMSKLRDLSELELLTGLSLEDMIRSAKSSKETKKQRKNFQQVRSTVLVFTANWADNSYFTYPIWV